MYSLVSDFGAIAISRAVALSCERVLQETAKRGLIDQKLQRKLVHISFGPAFMLCYVGHYSVMTDGHRSLLFWFREFICFGYL